MKHKQQQLNIKRRNTKDTQPTRHTETQKKTKTQTKY